MSRKLITVDGSDLIAEVSEGFEDLYVTIAYLGSNGLFIDGSDWKNFVELVISTDIEVKSLK